LLCVLLLPLLGTDARLQSPSLDTQLLTAAGRGDVAGVADLLDKGADINAENWRGASPLCSASEHGYVDVVKLLLDRGADVNARDLEWGRTSLINASVPASDAKHAEAAGHILFILV
jgi:ankyrin repeat protein